MKSLTLSSTLCFAATIAAFAGDPVIGEKIPADDPNLWDCHRVDSHAPIGVMGDHNHGAGEMMFSYRFMYMDMDGQRDGTNNLSSSGVFARGYMVAPTRMDMEMHMIGFMYAPSDWLTLMAMGSYQFRSMDHVTRSGSPARMMRGASFTNKSEGWGDLPVTALIKIYDQNRQRIHLNLGVSAPTGEFSELAYPMHATTGTWDLLPGATWLWQNGDLSGGAQAIGRIHLGENDHDFRYGNGVEGTSWLAYRLCDWASISGRLSLEWADDIRGEDSRIRGLRMAPPMDPANHGGTWLDSGIGLNLYGQEGLLEGHRLAIEGILPLYQDLNGPQLKRDWMLVVGWQKAF